jgi:pyridoxamine 5'-phosphate oxidase
MSDDDQPATAPGPAHRDPLSPAGPRRLAALRAHYADVGLDEAELLPDPLAQFARWLDEVVELAVPEPNAMVLSTADPSGQPSSRHVLLKDVGAGGFVFFTNYGSRKGRELAANPQASLCFPWFCIGRQVTVTGGVSKVTRAESEAYFALRPRDSQLGAWASERQSEIVPDRAWLDARFASLAARFADVEQIPAPQYWGGYRLAPLTIEFWQGRRSRMHDRLRYRRRDLQAPWVIERLSP